MERSRRVSKGDKYRPEAWSSPPHTADAVLLGSKLSRKASRTITGSFRLNAPLFYHIVADQLFYQLAAS